MRDRHLIGRDRELAELGRLLAAARNGTGGLVLLAGEAGVGKTRLAEVALVQSDLLVLPGGGSQDATLLAWADGSRGCPPLGGPLIRSDHLEQSRLAPLRQVVSRGGDPLGETVHDAVFDAFRCRSHGVLYGVWTRSAVGHDTHAVDAQERGASVLGVIHAAA
jgi:AAA ATPase domain